MKVNLICKLCNKKFSVSPCRENKAKYCSNDCSRIAFSNFCKSQIGEKNSNWKESIKKKCLICGKSFDVHFSRKDTAKFCSIKCANKGMERKKKYICLNCGEEFYFEVGRKRTFCSMNCRDNYWKGGNHPSYKPESRIKKVCLNCKKDFITLYKYRKHKFCSNLCVGEYHSGKRNAAWMGGVSFEPYPSKFNGKLKRKIKKRDNYICQLCGIPEQECLVKHSVHHIDYNKNNCEEINLITLCNSCHLKTNINRKKWQGLLLKKQEENHGFNDNFSTSSASRAVNVGGIVEESIMKTLNIGEHPEVDNPETQPRKRKVVETTKGYPNRIVV